MPSDTVVVALIVGVPATIVAVGGLIASLRNGVKLEQIHTLTNSNLMRVSNQLETANAKIVSLERLVASVVKGSDLAGRVAERNADRVAETPR